MSALVLFSGECTSIFAPLLRSDCRHCCICIKTTGGWRLETWDRGALKTYHGPPRPVDRLRGKLTEAGYCAVQVDIPEPDNRCEFWSCVFHVKHRLGLERWGLLTPYALYRHIA